MLNLLLLVTLPPTSQDVILDLHYWLGMTGFCAPQVLYLTLEDISNRFKSSCFKHLQMQAVE